MNITEQIIELEGISIPDLIKGERGEKGEQGERGEKGERGETPDLTGYATETYVDEAIKNAEVNVDLTGYATEAWVEGKGYLTEHQSLNGYATETYVNDAVKNAKVDVDLTGYATEKWVEGKGYLTQHQDISGKVNKADLSTVAFSGSYNDLTDKPSTDSGEITVDLSDYYTKTQIDNKGFLTEHQDISNLATKNEVSAVEKKIPTAVSELTNDAGYLTQHQSLAGFATETYVNDAVAAVDVPTKTSELTNDSGYATQTWVEGKGYLTQHQDISQLATKTEVSAVEKKIPTAVSELTNDANYITIEAVDNIDFVKSGDLATVATSGSYLDLTNLPSSVGTWVYTEDFTDAHIADATALIVAINANYAIQEALIILPQGAKMSDGDSWYFTYSGSSSSITAKSTYVKWSGTSLQCGQTLKYVYYATNVDIGTIVDFSAYAKTEDIPTKTSQLTNDSGFLTQHQSLAGFATEEWVGKQGYLTAHQDLSAYAKSADLAKVATSGSYNDLTDTPTIPSTVGLATTEEVVSAVSTHNTAADAHSDIRTLIADLTTKLNTLADSDDTTLDQLSEVVSYIKNNRSLIDGITTSKVNVADIVDNLTTSESGKPLSAAQGVALKALIDAITVPTKVSELENDSVFATTTYVDEKVAEGGGGGSANITYGTTDLEDGVSTLATGTLYLVYEE